MPIVSGSVYFDSTRTGTGTSPIANVPVVLRNTTTGNGLAVLTDSSGNFSFSNVPNGSYTLTEVWGFTPTVSSPGDFTSAANIATQPAGSDPPVSAITSPPANTNLIDSTSRNTIPITISGADSTGNIFRDGPITERPITVNDVTTIGGNIITAGSNGIWGTLPAGTTLASYANPDPYPGVYPGFTYINATPADGSVTVTNTTNLFGQGFIADHTAGDETGRMLVVNGANPGNLFFTNTVNVTPNAFYRFSTWILNLTAGALPQLGFRITTTGGTTIFQQIPSAVSFTTPRTWLEQGTVFNAGNNTQLNVQFFSNGPAAGGNDYTVDDIFVQEIEINDILSINKTVSKAFADVGDTLDYTIVLENTGTSTITNLTFFDTIPSGTTFTTGSVAINGTTQASFNPNPPGFTIPTPPLPMVSGEVITITFKVTVNTIPTINPIPNSAVANYAFAPIDGSATVPKAIASSIVTTQVNNGDLSISKSRDKGFANIGDVITYTIALANYGNVSSSNIVFFDTIPGGTSFIADSVTVNNITQVGANPNPPTGVSVGSLDPGQVATVTFQVTVTTIPTVNPIPNNSTSTYNYIVDPSVPAGKNDGVNSNTVTTRVNNGDLSSTKTVSKTFADVNDLLTYTIVLKNTGNTTTGTLVFSDTIPNGTTFVSGSVAINGSTQASLDPTPPGFTISSPVSTIGPSGTLTITYNVRVSTIPSPNPIPNTGTTTYNYVVDPSTPAGVNGSTNTNTVNTQVNNVNLGNSSKSVDKPFATCGDILTYTVLVPNTGNVTAQNVVFKDTIPTGTIFVTDSLVVNNVTQTGLNPSSGVTIPDIAPGATTTVTFKVQVNC